MEAREDRAETQVEDELSPFSDRERIEATEELTEVRIELQFEVHEAEITGEEITIMKSPMKM